MRVTCVSRPPARTQALIRLMAGDDDLQDLPPAVRTYIHIPGHGWWYAVTVIDYFGCGSFGALASRAREALRRGARWIIDTTAGLYRDDQPPEPNAT